MTPVKCPFDYQKKSKLSPFDGDMVGFFRQIMRSVYPLGCKAYTGWGFCCGDVCGAGWVGIKFIANNDHWVLTWAGFGLKRIPQGMPLRA